jgi:hypothetical protein
MVCASRLGGQTRSAALTQRHFNACPGSRPGLTNDIGLKAYARGLPKPEAPGDLGGNGSVRNAAPRRQPPHNASPCDGYSLALARSASRPSRTPSSATSPPHQRHFWPVPNGTHGNSAVQGQIRTVPAKFGQHPRSRPCRADKSSLLLTSMTARLHQFRPSTRFFEGRTPTHFLVRFCCDAASQVARPPPLQAQAIRGE